MKSLLLASAILLGTLAPLAHAADDSALQWRSDSTDPCRANHLKGDRHPAMQPGCGNTTSRTATPPSADDLSKLAPAAGGGTWRSDRDMRSDSSEPLRSDR